MKPTIISRAKWGAKFAYKLRAIPAEQIQCIVIHHSAHPTWGPKEVEASHIARKFLGIGYSYLIDRKGNIYAGREVAVQAAQGTTSGNRRHVSICILDDLTKRPVTAETTASLEALTTWLNDTYPNIKADVRPHSSFHATACPGKFGNEMVKHIKTFLSKKVLERDVIDGNCC